MSNTFKCGHTGETPRFMGRGMARQKRLEQYFARNCMECAIKKTLAEKWTKPNGTLLTAEERKPIDERNVARIRQSY